MITVSIVTYNTDVFELAKCLDSLKSSTIFKIYVIDNSNQIYIADFCKQYNKVEYISSDNVGYGAGHNIGIKKSINSGADYHLVLNSDVYFSPADLEKIIDYMDTSPDVGQLIPNTIYPSGEIQYVVRLLPSPMIQIFRRFFPDNWFRMKNDKFLLKNWDHKTPINVPFHMGCFMFLRNSVLKDVGLFNENIFMYMEDVDLTRRIHKKYKTMFWPEVTIVHDHKRGSYKSKKLMKIHIKSAITYFNKWGWLFDNERRKWNKKLLKDLEHKNTVCNLNDDNKS